MQKYFYGIRKLVAEMAFGSHDDGLNVNRSQNGWAYLEL